jgi:transcriptional regulator with XRE-family HTH domain
MRKDGLPRKRHRATVAERLGSERAAYLARRFGIAVRDTRRALGLRQRDVAARAGITQPHLSRIERGIEPGAPLTTLAACAAAVDVQLTAFIEARPGASLPRDMDHLRRQRLIVELSARGAWHAQPEAILQEAGRPPRSIDVLLTRAPRRECAVIEVWNLMPDVGDAMRGLESKVANVARIQTPDWRVAGLLVIRGTRRNRELVRQLAPLFRARYPAPSRAWLVALLDPEAPMPAESGVLWSSVSGDELIAARL